MRRAKNSLASTKSYLKKARAAGDTQKIAHLLAKLESDERRVDALIRQLHAES